METNSEWEPLPTAEERSSQPLSAPAPFFSQEALALTGIAGSLGSFLNVLNFCFRKNLKGPKR